MIPLRLLMIEDSEDDAALVVRELTRAGYAVSSERVETREALTSALERQRWDLAIADFSMPLFSGTAALTLLRQYDADVPFIFVSGTIGEDAAVAAMRSGANDYLTKGHLKRLLPAIERELREAAGRLSRKRAEARLVHLAYHDALTDLPNRVLLYDRLQQAVLLAQRAREPLAVLVLDLDGFKAINDSMGHHTGDGVLQEVATRLRALLRDADTVARLGGDEFALMLQHTDVEGATLAADKVLRELRRPLVLNGRPIAVGGSIGIACSPEHGLNAEVLLQRADIAMYVAKSGGFGYAVYTPDRDRGAHRRLSLMGELREGIEQGQFSLDYQPIVSLATGGVISVEALVRWEHPSHGRLSPGEFIDLAEQTGLIEPLTTYIIDKALAQWASASNTPLIPVAVNLSPRSLRDPELPDRVIDLLHTHQMPASALVFEITENVLVSDVPTARACLARLHDLGVKLAIDDFGAGYSSLSYLHRLPVDELKIDRSFVSALVGGDDTIVRSTIDLAHNLGLSVVAEGVETDACLGRLQSLGCDSAQGYFIAFPATADVIRQFATGQRTVQLP
jgi:diguanylate cyclase (GGDEF)-like protein